MPLALYVSTIFETNYTTSLELNATVKDVKYQIAAELEVDVRYFDLVFAGDVLTIEKDIVSLGVVDGSEVEMTISKRGFALKKLGKLLPTVENMIANIRDHNGDMLEYFLDAGVPINGIHDQTTALVAACTEANVKLAKLLLSRGAVVDIAILSVMHTSGDVFFELFNLLVGYGADLNATDPFGSTPLHHAIIVKNIVAVKELLSRGVLLNERCDSLTPLHFALTMQEVEIATLLIEAGCDLNAKEQMGYTPLHYALRECLDDTVQLLIKKGADLTIRDVQDKNALEFADESRPAMAELIRDTVQELKN